MMGKVETQHEDFGEDCHNNNFKLEDNDQIIKNIINKDMLTK